MTEWSAKLNRVGDEIMKEQKATFLVGQQGASLGFLVLLVLTRYLSGQKYKKE